jgi:hypothetical protein
MSSATICMWWFHTSFVSEMHKVTDCGSHSSCQVSFGFAGRRRRKKKEEEEDDDDDDEFC